MSFFTLCLLISSISFFAYGASWFSSPHMKNEFKRFNLEKFGLLTVMLELLGATGLLFGLLFNPFLVISSGGLALLMFFGVGVRIKIKDSLWVSLPAVFYLILNSYLFIESLQPYLD